MRVAAFSSACLLLLSLAHAKHRSSSRVRAECADEQEAKAAIEAAERFSVAGKRNKERQCWQVTHNHFTVGLLRVAGTDTRTHTRTLNTHTHKHTHSHTHMHTHTQTHTLTHTRTHTHTRTQCTHMHLQRAAELDDDDPAPLVKLGNMAHVDGKLDSARSLLEQARNLAPTNSHVCITKRAQYVRTRDPHLVVALMPSHSFAFSSFSFFQISFQPCCC